MKTKDLLLNFVAAILLPVLCASCGTPFGSWLTSPNTVSEITTLGKLAATIAPQYGAPIALGLYGLQAVAAANNSAPSAATIQSTVAAQSGGTIPASTTTALANAISGVISESPTPSSGLQTAAAKLLSVTTPKLQ